MTITTINEWDKLITPPPPIWIRWSQNNTTQMTGAVFQANLDKLTSVALQRQTTPSLEAAYQQELTVFYEAFKKRVSQFTLGSNVSSVALLQTVCQQKLAACPQIEIALLRKAQVEAFSSFSLPLQTQPVSGVEFSLRKIDVEKSKKAITDLLTTWGTMLPHLQDQMKKELYVQLLNQYGKSFQDHIKKLGSLDVSSLDSTMQTDLKRQAPFLAQKRREAENKYSSVAESDLRNRLHTFKTDRANQLAQIRTLLPLLKVDVLGMHPRYSALNDLERALTVIKDENLLISKVRSFLLYAYPTTAALTASVTQALQQLNAALDAYDRAGNEISEKESELQTFLTEKKENENLRKREEVEQRVFSASKGERLRFLDGKRREVLNQYEELLGHLRNPDPHGSSSFLGRIGKKIALILPRNDRVKDASYQLAVGVSACAVGYLFYWGAVNTAQNLSQTILGVAVTETVNSIGNAALSLSQDVWKIAKTVRSLFI